MFYEHWLMFGVPDSCSCCVLGEQRHTYICFFGFQATRGNLESLAFQKGLYVSFKARSQREIYCQSSVELYNIGCLDFNVPGTR